MSSFDFSPPDHKVATPGLANQDFSLKCKRIYHGRPTSHGKTTRPIMQAAPLLALPAQRPLSLSDLALPAPLTVVVLAPHPDDFDAIAVSLHYLHAQGHAIHVAVLTAGANGVDDGWNGVQGLEQKAALRQAEQRASCAWFGLSMDRLVFLRLWEAGEGVADPSRDDADYQTLRSYLRSKQPDLVFLPHGNDSNRTHRRTFETFEAIAAADKLQVHACLSQDAKTVSMRPDLYMFFGEEEAAWKAQLLRLHRSQQERNLKARGHGLDQRVLDVNREAAAKAGGARPYAEVFELRSFG
jgi:LmbE family N-acetylglucosaminyl deacetylase